MQVRADDIGDDALAHGALHKIEIEVTAGMAHVEDHAALFGGAHLGKQFALLIDNRRFLRRVAMGNHITGPKRCSDLAHWDAGIAPVNHHRRPRSFASTDPQTQSLPSLYAPAF